MEEDDNSCTNVEASSTSSLSNPQLPVDLVDQTELLKGDAIGNTLYSERFVLKTLIKLSQVSQEIWTEDFENDICFLWDMTIERDVVLLLMKHDFLRLSVSLMQGPLQEPRFIEIIVGILRNMSCVDEVRQAISDRSDMTQLLMQLLSSSDTLTLIQLVRLLHSVAWDLVKQVDQRASSIQKHWLEKEMDNHILCDKLSFLLCSSTNGELLYGVLDILNTICTYGPTVSDKDFSRSFATAGMVSSLLECWNQLFPTSSSVVMDEDTDGCGNDKVGNELFLDKYMFKSACRWVATVASFTGHEKGREALVSNGDQLNVVMSRIISQPYDDDHYDEMLTDIVNILESLISTHFECDITKQLITLFSNTTQIIGDIVITPERLVLREAFENYFESTLKYGSRAKLSETLEMCDESLVVLFWTVMKRRDQDLVDSWKSVIKPFDERSI